MPEKRRKFSPQFRAEAVQLVIETGKPVAEVARDLGVNDGTLGNWVKAWRDANSEPAAELSPVERAHVRELVDENRKLRLENEFLKKAALDSTSQRNMSFMKWWCGLDRSARDVGCDEGRSLATLAGG